MRIVIVLILFFLLPNKDLQAQENALDSLHALLKNTKSDTARMRLYVDLVFNAEDTVCVLYSDTAITIGKKILPSADGITKTTILGYLSDAYYYRSMFFSVGESYDTALHYLSEAMKPALAAGNRTQEARILNDMGVCFYHKNDVVNTIDYLKKSLAIREELNDDEQLRNAYNNSAFIYKETGLIDNSLELNFKALALGEKRKNDDETALSLNNIGYIYHKYLKDYTKATEYYTKALKIREKIGDKKGMSLIKSNIAGIYFDEGEYAASAKLYSESLDLRRDINYKYGIINCLNNLSSIYIRTKEYNKVRTSLAESYKLNESLKDKTLQTSIHRNYAELYNILGKTDSALYHARLSHGINLEFGNPLNISWSAELIAGLYEKSGDYKDALEFYKLHKKMQDSILNDNLKKEGVKSDIEYQYLKKKNESDKIYNERIARKNLYTWLLVIFFVAAGVIAFVLYKRYRLKQRLKEVEIRNKIASDLHDDVGSTLSSIRMYSDIVKMQPNQTTTSADLLNKISSNSKEMIENMSDIVWMIKPGNDAFHNVENKMLNFANELCVPAGINFDFAKEEGLSEIKIPMELRRDIYLIFKEAVNNAVKYAHCHSINTSISKQNNQLQMRITDDGKGFDASIVKKGNGLFNMQQRAATHKGTVIIQSAEEEGTEIIASFPV